MSILLLASVVVKILMLNGRFTEDDEYVTPLGMKTGIHKEWLCVIVIYDCFNIIIIIWLLQATKHLNEALTEFRYTEKLELAQKNWEECKIQWEENAQHRLAKQNADKLAKGAIDKAKVLVWEPSRCDYFQSQSDSFDK